MSHSRQEQLLIKLKHSVALCDFNLKATIQQVKSN